MNTSLQSVSLAEGRKVSRREVTVTVSIQAMGFCEWLGCIVGVLSFDASMNAVMVLSITG
jgi:hypothetical protein